MLRCYVKELCGTDFGGLFSAAGSVVQFGLRTSIHKHTVEEVTTVGREVGKENKKKKVISYPRIYKNSVFETINHITGKEGGGR